VIGYGCRVANIAVVHVPFFSHINAATRLTAVLVRQGHEVTAWAPEPCRRRIEEAGAAFVAHEPEMPEVDGFEAWVAALAATTVDWSKVLVQELFDLDPDLIVHDSQVPWARVAGEHLGIPRIVSHPMFPIVSPHAIRSEQDWSLPVAHPEDAKKTFEDSWLSIANRWGVELGNWGDVIHSAEASETTLAYTTEKILGDFVLSDAWKMVGPLMDPPPPRAPRGERPVVYVCFGTSFNARPEHFRAVTEGLADEPVDVLVSTGAGVITPEDLAPLPANVAVRDFVPARDMLARADVHITHGGCNSVHECLLAGVPMLLIPQAYDQFPLTVRVQELGAGRGVNEDPEDIRNGVRWLLSDDGPTERARELGRHLAEFDGEARIAAIVDGVLSDTPAVSA
jgi:MGT family glycosyltransferase